jgi:hypothetical protein
MKDLVFAWPVMAIGIATAVAQPTPAPTPAAGAAVTNAPGPKIRFASPLYDFGRVRSGEPVKYTYIFTNAGDEMLILSNVQPQCGCTAAGEWSRQVEPGKTGSIPIQFNTMNYNGQVFKQVTVTCNDKSQPMLFLQLKGTIYKPLDVNPQLAVLNVSPDAEAASAVITITNNTDEPLTLSAPESNNKAFAAELKTNTPGKSYQLLVKTVPPLNTGGVQAQISMKTSWTNQPVLNVSVYANVQPSIVLIPSHITLPPGPLASAQAPQVTIQNNSTNLLSLSEPAVNVQGVETQLKENQPGRSFLVVATFPQGFELPPGQQVELTVKTSNPKYPVVKVPVTQLPRVATPPPPIKPPPTAAVQPPPAPLRPGKPVQVEMPPLPPDLPKVR